MVAKMKVMEVLLVAAITMVGVATVSHVYDESPAEFVIIQDGEGTIDPMAGTYTIQKGNDLTLHMTAAEGYMLSMITLNGVITSFEGDSITLTIDDYTEIHVYFTSVEVDIPESKDLVYNGETIVAYDPLNPQYTVVGGSAKDVGEYTAKLTLRHPDVAHWSDGTVEDKEIVWNILPRDISEIYFEDIGSYAYTGVEIEPALRPIAPLTVDDIDVEYSDNILPGTAYAEVTAKGNFTGSVRLEFEIVPASLIVKADDRTIVYGDDPRPYTFTIDGFVDGQDITDLTGSVNVSCDYMPGYDVGTYDIVVSGLSSDNYDIVFQKGVLTVEQFELKREHFDIDTSDERYDGTEKRKSVELKDEIPFIEEGSEYVVEHRDNRNVGIATIVITGKGNCKGVVTENFEIVAKAVNVHAVHKEKVYGQADPAFTVEIDGVIDGDSIRYTIDRAEGENVGAYVIDVSGEREQGNYIVTFTDDYFVITPKDITFTSGSKEKVYDGTPLTYDSVTGIDGLEFDDVVEFTVTGSQTDVGTSDNTFTYLFTKGIANNYDVHLVFGKLTVKETLSTIVVTADSATKLYDGTPLTEKGFTYTGTLAGTDRLVVEIEGSITDVLYVNNEVSYVKNHVVSVKVMRGDVDVSENYSFGTHIDGKLKVTPRNVVLISDFNEKVYDGTSLKDDHVEVLGDGFVSDSDVSWTVIGSQTDVGSSKNTFTYTLNNDVKGNYVVTKYEGTLTVIPKGITVTADDLSKVYGAQDPELTYGVSENGDLDVSGIVVDLEREAGEDVGEYDIIASGAKLQGNYSIKFIGGKFTINKAALTITADDKTKVYGDKDPKFTATASGLQFNDTIEVAGTLTFDRADGKDIGDYDIVVSGAASVKNYDITYVKGKLTIVPKEITVTADDNIKAFAQNDPELTATVKGLVEGDTIIYTLGREAGEDVGVYEISVTGAEVQGNYIIEYVNGRFTIVAAGVNAPSAIPDLKYDGKEQTGVTEGTGYTIVDNMKVDAGSYRAVATLKAGYVWSDGTNTPKEIAWSIAKRDVTLTSATDEWTYDGEVHSNEDVEVTGDGFVTNEGVTFSDFATITDVGDCRNTFAHDLKEGTKASNYNIDHVTGTLTVNKRVVKLALSPTGPFTYDGVGKSVVVQFVDDSIAQGDKGKVDCVYDDASVFKNVDAGIYKIIVTGLSGERAGNYALPDVTVTLEWKISAKSLTPDCKVEFDVNKKYVYNALEQTFVYSIYDSVRDVTIDSDDYIVSGDKGKDAKGYTLVITGKGNYSGELKQDWKIEPYAISVTDFEQIVPHVYTGSKIEPAVVPNNDISKSLVNGEDYTVSYENNKDVGTAKAIVTAVAGSNAIGVATIEFSIYHGLSVYVTKDVNGNVCYERLFSFVGDNALFNTVNIAPGMPTQTVEMSVLYGGSHPEMHLGLVVKYLDSNLSIVDEAALAKRILLTVERDGASYSGSIYGASQYIVNLGRITNSDVSAGSDALKVTMSFPSTGDDNDVMESTLSFEFGFCLWHAPEEKVVGA